LLLVDVQARESSEAPPGDRAATVISTPCGGVLIIGAQSWEFKYWSLVLAFQPFTELALAQLIATGYIVSIARNA
jgi:hypothetical protein